LFVPFQYLLSDVVLAFIHHALASCNGLASLVGGGWRFGSGCSFIGPGEFGNASNALGCVCARCNMTARLVEADVALQRQGPRSWNAESSCGRASHEMPDVVVNMLSVCAD
jgi:hypothetical protein